MKTLNLIICKFDNKKECVTNNPKEWIKEHNKTRDIESKENLEEFDILKIEYFEVKE